jgi:hypothetical protein
MHHIRGSATGRFNKKILGKFYFLQLTHFDTRSEVQKRISEIRKERVKEKGKEIKVLSAILPVPVGYQLIILIILFIVAMHLPTIPQRNSNTSSGALCSLAIAQ